MRDLARERRKARKVCAGLAPRVRLERRVKISRAIKCHLRQQFGAIRVDGERIVPTHRLMQDERYKRSLFCAKYLENIGETCTDVNFLSATLTRFLTMRKSFTTPLMSVNV